MGRSEAGHSYRLPNTTLSPRQLAAARLVTAGKTHREAALELRIGYGTFGNHLKTAYLKLGVRDRMSAYLALRDRGLLAEQVDGADAPGSVQGE